MERGSQQPPLVADSGTCLCRSDASRKAAGSGARKYVPTSKICVQPNVKPLIQKSYNKQEEAWGERSRVHSPLLAGLPDDLAIACLVRVARSEHQKLRLVCRRWLRLLSGNYYYSQRQSLGLAEEWVYVIKRDRGGQASWEAFDPASNAWQPLPPIPMEYQEAVGFGCAVLGGCHLFLFGGKDPNRGSMRRVVFYSARTNKWHRAPDMLRRRHLFGSCVMDNRLYVAGGESEGGHRALRSAEVYDPGRNRWSFIAEMSTTMVPFIGVVYGGRWYLKGLGAHRQVLSEVYVPEADSWFPVLNGMVSGWRNPSVCLDGRLYSADCKDGCRLRAYDDASDSWSGNIDSGNHLGGSRSLEAAALVALRGKLCVVRNNTSMSLVDVGGSRRWENLAGKGQLMAFVTNLWSSLSGRKHPHSHILHCQVLKA